MNSLIEHTQAEVHESLTRLDQDINTVAPILAGLESQFAGRLVYDIPDDMLAEHEEFSGQLAVLERHREREQARQERLGYNSLLFYADEIDPADFAPILSDHDVLDHFMLPEPMVGRSKKAIYLALDGLPFLGPKLQWGAYGDIRVPTLEIRGPLQFPVARISGVTSFRSWAGRGLYPNDDDPDYSLKKIIRYAQVPEAAFHDAPRGAVIEMIQDFDGRLWGVASTDGSHRVAAAKLRGDRFVQVARILITERDYLPAFPLPV